MSNQTDFINLMSFGNVTNDEYGVTMLITEIMLCKDPQIMLMVMYTRPGH